jgi:hypothetical protein
MQFGGYRVGPRSCGCGNIPDVTELCSWTHTLGYLLHGVLVKINNTSKLIFPLMFYYDFFFFLVLALELRVLYMLGKCFTTELHVQPFGF